ncbi:Mss4-like protein [Ochromonadaceae sp. CCMP2298]|nr:Mss4-like protein [Ochromonadaceae sp. CCMP2298]
MYGSKYSKEGTYTCVGCGEPLYTAKSKFDSGCGWPAFYEGVPGAIKDIPDKDGFRVEIVCNNCESHLGHVFKGEGFPGGNERHCVNGICLNYVPSE